MARGRGAGMLRCGGDVFIGKCGTGILTKVLILCSLPRGVVGKVSLSPQIVIPVLPSGVVLLPCGRGS